MKETCPLCLAGNNLSFHTDDRREYLRCDTCKLVFVPPMFHLSKELEKAEYDLHENSPEDQGYRRFLGRLCDPLNERLEKNRRGLDFGCGPGPTLSVMLEELGHFVELFDPFYAPNPGAFQDKYDFITATEVFEHLREPRVEIDRLWKCLRPGGLLGVMTKLVADRTAFSQWHYIRDLTHVSFFSSDTFRWIAGHLRAEFDQPNNDVVFLRKVD